MLGARSCEGFGFGSLPRAGADDLSLGGMPPRTRSNESSKTSLDQQTACCVFRTYDENKKHVTQPKQMLKWAPHSVEYPLSKGH
jgi:hypothetical protein